MKILIVSGKLNIGGAQAVAANIAEYADDNMHFDYIVFGNDVGEYEPLIEAKGNRVLHLTEPNGHLIRCFRQMYQLMKQECYDVVHCHTMFNCGIVLLAAKLAEVRGRIAHSHTTKIETEISPLRKMYMLAMRMLIWLCANECLACGVDAGNALYGETWFSKHGTVIANGINISNYMYTEENRRNIRDKYGLSDSFVIGHVGHYEKVKNQRFLLQLLPLILKQRPNTKLLMFGEGSTRNMLEEMIKEQHLTDSAYLMGNVDNINEVLSAFDVFVFPSLFEGTPLALIEAQANGLPCIISDAIPADACILEDVCSINLEADAGVWVAAICNAQRQDSQTKASQVRERYGNIQDSMEHIYEIFRKYN